MCRLHEFQRLKNGRKVPEAAQHLVITQTRATQLQWSYLGTLVYHRGRGALKRDVYMNLLMGECTSGIRKHFLDEVKP